MPVYYFIITLKMVGQDLMHVRTKRVFLLRPFFLRAIYMF